MARRPNNYLFEWFVADDLFVKTRRWFGKSKYFIDNKEVSKEVWIKKRNELLQSDDKRETLQYERSVPIDDGGFVEEYW